MHGKNYVGNTLAASGSITYKTFNPLLNTENETVFYEATAEEIGKAVELAKDAFTHFSATPDIRKAEFLDAIADEIMNDIEMLQLSYSNTVLELGLKLFMKKWKMINRQKNQSIIEFSKLFR